MTTSLFTPVGNLVSYRYFNDRLDAGADPNEVWRGPGITTHIPIVMAAEGQTRYLEALLDHPDIDLEAAAFDGRTALITACLKDNDQALELLIKAGANVNSLDLYQASPLHYAVKMSGPNGVHRLLAAGADVNIRGAYERTPIMEALMEFTAWTKPVEEKVRLLLDSGADLGLVDDEGRSALHYAADSAYPLIVDWLLAKGADPELFSSPGLRPQDMGRRYLTQGTGITREAYEATQKVFAWHRRERLAQVAKFALLDPKKPHPSFPIRM